MTVLTKEELKKLYQELEEADEKYHSYVGQFLHAGAKKTARPLGREELKTIRGLREEVEKLRNEWKDALYKWLAT